MRCSDNSGMNTKLKNILPILVLIICWLSGCEDSPKTDQNSTKNRLSEANSPYLIQHADNPVDWYEWGPEALKKAEKEDKLVIISVGYAACHWCHVMEEESFMDTTVAEVMNQNFISIKIDREERPDIDKIYMNASQLLTGSGGWPLNVIALPNGKPFFAGTYFPADEWKDVLIKITETYKEDKNRITAIADELTEGIKNANSLDSLTEKKSQYSRAVYRDIFDNWQGEFDIKKGGYKGIQKFPLPVTWDALLQYYYLTGDQEALETVKLALNNMSRGGIYDQLGGGFARYTTDPDWLIPHFEKMLYDNAQLVDLYSKAYKVNRDREYKAIIEQTLEFIERELGNSEGGFFSSVNADSEGEEGKYYVWSLTEIEEALNSREAKLISDYYNISRTGNWEEGKNVLHRRFSENEYAHRQNLSRGQFESSLAIAKKKLLNKRQQRVKPSIDDKSLTSWNALMIDAYLQAFSALGDKEYLEKAIQCAEFLDEKMVKKDFSLWRSYRNGKTGVNAFLDDYAFLSGAYLNLYQTTFDKKWLQKAKGITDYTIKNFRDEISGMFFFTADDESLVISNIELDDDVVPSSNSAMAKNLYVIGNLLGQRHYLEMSEGMLQQMTPKIIEDPAFYANWTKLLGLHTYGAYEIAVIGDEAFEKSTQLQREYLPTSIFIGGEKENLPLLEGKYVQGKTLIYVCQNKTCKYPVSGVKEAANMLEEYRTGVENPEWFKIQ